MCAMSAREFQFEKTQRLRQRLQVGRQTEKELPGAICGYAHRVDEQMSKG